MLLPNSVHYTDRLKKEVYTTYVQTGLGRIYDYNPLVVATSDL